MKKQNSSTREYYAIDLRHVAKSLWRRAWIIALVGILTAAIAFGVSAFIIPPQYSSSIKLYVNNSSGSNGNTISSSELSAAQSLVKTYGEILDSRTTLELVINKAGIDYTWKELSKMIECEPSNGTEIMKVTVTTGDPYEAALIANAISEVLPVRITEVIDGASMKVAESAVPELEKVSPNTVKFTVIGLALGIVLCALVLFILAMLDDTIHDEDYVINNYDYPILGKVPDLLYAGNKEYGYYYKKDNMERGNKA